MQRMTDAQYKSAITQLETAEALTKEAITALSTLADERHVRCLEAILGKRSTRSAMNNRFIALVNGLESRFNCKLTRYDIGKTYEIKPAGWSRWASLAK